MGADAPPLVPLRTVRSMCPHLRDDQLRYLEKWGLVRPARTPQGPQYGFADLAVIRQANAGLARGASFRSVLRQLVAEREGQLTLDFQPPRIAVAPAEVVWLAARGRRRGVEPLPSLDAGPSAAEPSAAERHFLEAADLDRSSPSAREAAMARYRAALALDPGLAPALVNLGNLHYSADQFPEAEALYRYACALDEASFEARFNLGNVCHDLRRFEEAAACYREALQIDAAYADAHFYLAVTLEKLGRSGEARPHWRRYLELAPGGEWVELAREFGE